MSAQSAELKLRTLAAQNAQMIALFQSGNRFLWFDRQLAQADVTAPVQPVSSNPVYMGVVRVSTSRVRNQGAVTALSLIRLQLMITSYSAENARLAAQQVVGFMNSISLCSAGEFASPQISPTQNPNGFLNERSGMLYQLQPPAYTEIQDWHCWNREDIPS